MSWQHPADDPADTGPVAQTSDTATARSGMPDSDAAEPRPGPRASGSAREGRGILASDGDRDAVAGRLGGAFAEGRLTADEHGERIQAAYAARTRAELARLTADLPAPPGHTPGRPAPMLEGVDRCVLCAVLVLCPPAGIAWLLALRRRARHGRRPGQAGAPGAGYGPERPVMAGVASVANVPAADPPSARSRQPVPRAGGTHAEDR